MNTDFQHGYNSGLERVSADTYEGYLSSQVNYEWLTERLTEKRADLARVDSLLTDTPAKRQTTFDALQTHLLKISTLAKQVTRLETDRAAIETEQAQLQQRRALTVSEYSLLAGLLFLVAGVSFLAGDLIISHEIVAYALNIRDNTEAWAFAVGLAMVSILLKPAYDRLIEGPYKADPVANGRRYQRFKVGLAVLSVLTLVVLGWFRYEAYRTDQLKAAINKSIKNLQLNAPLDADGNPVPLTPAVMQQIEKQLQNSDSLNLDLVNSPIALLSFVLSGLLFALAGAVCLGIALPVLAAFWLRWLQVDRRRWTLRQRLNRLMKKLLPAEQALAEQVARKAVLEHELALLPDLEALKTEKKALLETINNLLNDSRLAQTDSRIATFNDGYSKGEVTRDLMTDDAFLRAQQNNATLEQLGAKTRTGSPDRIIRGRGLRPYQAIRKIITDSFDADNG